MCGYIAIATKESDQSMYWEYFSMYQYDDALCILIDPNSVLAKEKAGSLVQPNTQLGNKVSKVTLEIGETT